MAKTKAEYNAYMRVYMLKRYHRRRTVAIMQLGGKCAVTGCDVSEYDSLEIDHIEAKKKSFTLADALAGWSEKRVQAELLKCQLLCRKHHQEKTMKDLGVAAARGTHGTLSSFRYCKCDLCREAHNAWNREYKRKQRLEAGMKPRKRREF